MGRARTGGMPTAPSAAPRGICCAVRCAQAASRPVCDGVLAARPACTIPVLLLCTPSPKFRTQACLYETCASTLYPKPWILDPSLQSQTCTLQTSPAAWATPGASCSRQHPCLAPPPGPEADRLRHSACSSCYCVQHVHKPEVAPRAAMTPRSILLRFRFCNLRQSGVYLAGLRGTQMPVLPH